MKKRFVYLLVPIVVLLLIQPLAAEGYTYPWVNAITELGVVAGALIVFRHNRRVSLLVGGFFAVSLFAIPAGMLASSSAVGVIGTLAVVSALVVTLTTIAGEAVKEEWVTSDTILGAMVVYLLLGIGFAMMFEMAYRLEPDTFTNVAGLTRPERMAEMVYFSLVTMTTLGYGDIAPTGGVVRILAVMEAVVGQFFVAAVVGVLVSRHSSIKTGTT